MDDPRRKIHERLRQTLYPDKHGRVNLTTISSILKDFGLTEQSLGKYVRQVFDVVIKYGRGPGPETYYEGVSLNLSSSNVPALSHGYQLSSASHTIASLSSEHAHYRAPSVSRSTFLPSGSSQPSTPFQFSTGHMPGTPFQSSTGHMPSTPFQFSTGQLPSIPFQSSTGQLPSIPFQFSPTTPAYSSLVQTNTQLQEHIRRLEEENKALHDQIQQVGSLNHVTIWKHVDRTLSKELLIISGSKGPLSGSIRTLEDITNLKIEGIRDYISSNAPHLYHLITSLMNSVYQEDDGYSSLMLISSITHARNQRCNMLQTIISLYLLLSASQHEVIQMMNRTHQCVAFNTAWRVIEQFSDASKETTLPQTTEIWTYDNINIMKRVRHVRKEHHAQMLNWTSRLVLPARYLPSDDLGKEPQGLRQNLVESDILPTMDDVTSLKSRLVDRTVRLLVEKFKPCSQFSDRVSTSTTCVKRSTYTPLEVLDRDESKTSENIQILLQFAKDRGLGDDCQDQVVFGDQATCKNIRGAKRFRQTEDDHLQSLQWPKENPGDFHFHWEAGRTTLHAFWSSPRNVGSIGNLRDLVDRRTVDSRGKNFNSMDELLHHIEEAHLTTALLTYLGLETTGDDFDITEFEQVKDLAKDFVETLAISPFSQQVNDELYKLNHRLLYHLLLYTDLRQCIRDENGPAIVEHWKFWFPLFLGTGRGNYSYECVNLIANLQADWSEQTAFIATANRTVNLHGKSGHGKAVDMMVEHYNRLLKSILRGSGPGLTIEHAKRVSLAIPLLEEARRFCVRTFKTSRTTSHTSRSAASDVSLMVEAMCKEKVYTPREGRCISLGNKYKDPIDKAFVKINDNKWLAKALKKGTKAWVPDVDLVEVDTDILMDE